MNTSVVESPWPPSYQVRHSKKAKNIHVQITPHKGLEIVIPLKKRFYVLDEILETHRRWIEKNLKKYKIESKKSDELNSLKKVPLPSIIYFKALDKTVTIEYQKADHQRIKMKCLGDNHWQITGMLDSEPLVLTFLKRWLKKEAQKYLILWLKQLSVQTGLVFKNLSIRHQSTLWGSCSSDHKISLNAKLLFLPSNIVQYVLLHELCHTRHLNHSNRFWKLLSQFDPNYREHKYLLKQAFQYLPSWSL